LKSVNDSVQGLLKDLSEADFNQNKEFLSVQLTEKPKGLGEQSVAYMLEIANQYYNFNRAKIEVEELKLITKKDIIDFYNVRHTARFKFSIHILRTALCNKVCQFDYRKKSVALVQKDASWLFTSNHLRLT